MQDPNWYAPPIGSIPPPEPAGAPLDVELEPGSFWLRAGARAIDLIALTICGAGAGAIGGVIVGLLGAAGAIDAGWQARIGQRTIMTFVMSMVASLLYHSLTEAVGGATIGKAICGLRVITEDRRPCTFAKALARNLAYYVDAFFFGAVAWSSMSKSPTKQRVGDTWAGTIVVHRARELPPQNLGLGIAVGVVTALVLQAAGIVLKGI